MAKIDPKFLKGLKFHGNESKEVEENGLKITRWFPTERDLTSDDVNKFEDLGD